MRLTRRSCQVGSEVSLTTPSARGVLLHVEHKLFELGVLFVPTTAQFLEPLKASLARLMKRGEPTAVHPHVGAAGSRLDAHDQRGGAGEQFTVVRNKQHRLDRLPQLVLKPELARDVEVVVRLVEQQHLVGAAQQGLERFLAAVHHPAARQRAERGTLRRAGATAPRWPWKLTPLLAQATGAWLISFGVAAAHALLERDARRLRPTAVGYVLLAVLQSIALARYPHLFEWRSFAGVVYLIFLATMLLTGAVGLVRSARNRIA
jgi:hypothetical protein